MLFTPRPFCCHCVDVGLVPWLNWDSHILVVCFSGSLLGGCGFTV